MATTRTLYGSSRFAFSSSSTQPHWSYDVFLSFRGEDTRKNFTDHLYAALVQVGIHTFMDDDELPRGHDISSALLKSIEESRTSIVVFSTNYAFSIWCLDELVKIIECKKTLRQLVLPLFYDVDPFDVRHQTGCFREAFGRHEKHYVDEMEKVEVRKAALSEAANLSGWDLQNLANGYEAKFIRKIVKEVLCELKCTFLNVVVHPVGIDSRVEHINLLLSSGSDDVRMIGIYGLGVIGKTTIAKAVCSKNLKIGSVDRGVNLMKERLHSKKVLIVLDDVDQSSQLNNLAGNRDWFGLGSRIIITARDEHLFKGLKVDERYMPEELNHIESLQLFSWHAFRETNPLENFAELANDIISYARGLPLALEILGSYLFGRNILEWKNYVITILNSYGFFAQNGISVLVSRCLLRISERNELLMHDLLRDIGREIIREKYPKEPEKRSRLWFHEDVCYVLTKKKGTKAIDSVILTLPMLKKIQWSNKTFVRMHKLRLLQINHVHLSGNFEDLLEELRWLCWHNCPLENLPSNFHPEKLVILDMQFSRFKTLRIDGKFESLKILNLSNCKCLTKSPIFCAILMLEELLLESCTGLMELHESSGLLDKLVHLNLKYCINLRYEFPEHLGHMESLTELLADGTTIKQLPFSIGLLKNLRRLCLKGFNRQLTTESWLSLISSWVLPRKNADSIRFLPSSVLGLCSLTELDLSDHNLSEGYFLADLRSLSSLQVLDLSGNNFHNLPYGFSHLSKLEDLKLNNCRSLQSILDLPLNLLEDGMEEPHYFQGAQIIPLDRLNNLQSDFYYISDFSDSFSYKITGSSLIYLEVPIVQREDDYIAGFTLRVVYYRAGDEESCSMELNDSPYVIITDKINGIDFTYIPQPSFGIPGSCGDYVWESYIKVENILGIELKMIH
ncbi:unnamed protein product [Camellia sinensis]